MVRRHQRKFTGYVMGITVCGFMLGIASEARADIIPPTMTMCITNVDPTSNPDCDKGSKLLGTGSILLTSNGTTITESKHGSESFTNLTGSSPLDLIAVGSLGMFSGLDIDGEVDESADNVLDLSFNGRTKGLRDLWIEFNFNDFTGGAPFSLSAGGTEDKTKDVFWGCFTGSGLWCKTSGTIIGTESSPFPSTPLSSTVKPPTTPFGLGIELEIIPKGSGSTSGDLSAIPTTTIIPEPTGIVLLGTGILALLGVPRSIYRRPPRR